MPSTPSLFSRSASFSAAPAGANGTPSTPAATSSGQFAFQTNGATLVPPAQQQHPQQPAPNILVPQALSTSYSGRLKTFNTSLISPIIQQTTGTLPSRSSKRGQNVINYAEEEDDDFEDRSDARKGYLDTDEEGRPVEIRGKLASGIRPSFFKTDEQYYEASLLPCTLIPIRLDIDLNPTTRLKDAFMWNLYESLITVDQFAQTLCLDLNLPLNPYVGTISSAMRSQIEEFAPTATIAFPEPLIGKNPSHRVVINIQLYVGKFLYQDKFEWDLMSDRLTPETFSKVVCTDLGLTGEFQPLIAHAVYEAVMKSKKEMFESGSIHMGQGTLDNDAALGSTNGAGWRYETDALGMEWGPSFEQLTRDEIEKREGDRERQIRRARRETARFTTGTNLNASFLFDTQPSTPGRGVSHADEEILGRGERKRRKRNLSGSPSGTPKPGGKEGTPAALAALGFSLQGAVQLSDYERSGWRCAHCLVPGTGTWVVREGPKGPKTLCNICGGLWKQAGQKLPSWRLEMYKYDYWATNR